MHALDRLSDLPILPAPMVGLSHYAVRVALQDFVEPSIPTLWPTEMLSSRRVPYEKTEQSTLTIFRDHPRGLWPQLLGNERRFIEPSIKKLEDWGALAIDINMGCPVKHVLKHNYGVALMGDIDYAARVTEMAAEAAIVPVSVKLRVGFQKDEDFLVRFAKGLENAGASWITLHPRTALEGRKGEADWSQIELVRRELKIPVVGNGDIQCLEDIQKMKFETHCDRVMVGRALLGKPHLLQSTRMSVEPQDLKKSPSNVDSSRSGDDHFESIEYSWSLRTFLLKVIEVSESVYTEEEALKKLRFLLFHNSVWLEFGHFLFAQIKSSHSLETARERIEEFFATEQRMFKRTFRRR